MEINESIHIENDGPKSFVQLSRGVISSIE